MNYFIKITLFRFYFFIACAMSVCSLCCAAQSPNIQLHERKDAVEDPSTAETDVDEPDEDEIEVCAKTEPIYGVSVIPHLSRYYEPTDLVAIETFGLFECNRKDCVLSRSGSLFSLSRPYLARAREVFEAFIVDDIVRHNDPEKPLVYASFGCGGLLQDFRLIRQLAEHGFTKFIINCIDRMYDQTSVQANWRAKSTERGMLNVHCYDDRNDCMQSRFLAFALCVQKTGGWVVVNFYDGALPYCLACDKDPQRKSHVVVSVDMVLSKASPVFLPPFKRIIDEASRRDARFYVLAHLQLTSASMFIGDNASSEVQEYGLLPAAVFKGIQRISYNDFFDDSYWKLYAKELLQQDGSSRACIKAETERKTAEGV